MNPVLCLASTSPRRRELLQQIGLEFEVLKLEVDESVRPDESPDAYVRRLAEAKARAGLMQRPDALVLAADTTVVCDGLILGKPATLDEALAIWRRLSGRGHQVMTGVAVASRNQVRALVAVTEVRFRTLTDAEMRAYWNTGEPCDKAGGYGIQGKGALLVEKIDGSYSNVVGLPLAESAELLRQFGYSVW